MNYLCYDEMDIIIRDSAEYNGTSTKIDGGLKNDLPRPTHSQEALPGYVLTKVRVVL